MGDLVEPSGSGAAAAEGDDRPAPSSNPSPSSIGPDRWATAEKVTQSIIFKVQPSAVSEERRREVINYVQRLIKTCLGCEVFRYGSVPLKTYLPDGDIDLTVFGGATSEDTLVDDMVSVLEGEDQNRATEFVVKDVQLIRAEVKLVKCIVQNLVVDISFNQIGGLCTLCFLEQVDRLIGKDHLFKRSIILIKAWCYYESRILGAHHGLISTYALETLVLYIFHLFHSTLNGPLAVLYKFLDYFSKFNWENYCISLTSPVAETAEYVAGDLLLSNDFLRYCIDTFSVSPRGVDLSSRTFQLKHLNIVDPLKENNNLGRSVSQANFYRIRSAFTYGARKLRRLLVQPGDDIDDGLCKFFSNTLNRHRSGQRPDAQCPRPVRSYNGFSPALKVLETESCQLNRALPKSKPPSCMDTGGDFRYSPDSPSHNSLHDMKASEEETKQGEDIRKHEVSTDLRPSKASFEAEQPEIGNALDHRISGVAKELATISIGNLENKILKCPDIDNLESASPVSMPFHAPRLYFSNSTVSNGDLRNESLGQKKMKDFRESMYSGMSHGSDGRINDFSQHKNLTDDDDEVLMSTGLEDGNRAAKPVSCPDDLCNACGNWVSDCETLEPLNKMSDLSGDYDSHLSCLQHARWYFQYASSISALTMHPPTPPPIPSPLQMNNLWDGVQQPSQFKRNGYSHGSVNGVITTPAFYTVNPLLIPGVSFGSEDMRKPRGIGTYFPNTSRTPQGYRPSAVKGINQSSSRSPRSSNGRNMTFTERSIHDHTIHELSQSNVSVEQSSLNNGRGRGHLNANGVVLQAEDGFEFGSVGQVPVEETFSDRSKKRLQRSLTLSTQNSNPVSATAGMQKGRPVLSRDDDRVSVKSSYHLKDEDDFPPLSV